MGESSDRLKAMKEKSKIRKMLLAQGLQLDSPEALRSALNLETSLCYGALTSLKCDSAASKSLTSVEHESLLQDDASKCRDDADKDGGDDEKDEDDEKDKVYTDSSTFLKEFEVEGQEKKRSLLAQAMSTLKFEEYPKQRELIRLKDEIISSTNIPPMYLMCDLQTFNLHDLNVMFDVILIEPPLEEYRRTQGAIFEKYWNWDEIDKLDILAVAAQRSFLWIWCGNTEGLKRGRLCLKKWGFRRCEDICWIKTNIRSRQNRALEPNAVFNRTKEHCLMGIKGTVKRSTDGNFIHANVDIDLIIEDEPEFGCKDKPVEIFHIIEHFCLGRRRLHLFGRDSTIRPGWLTLGPGLTSSNFDAEAYTALFQQPEELVTGCTEEVERLRPKSPTPKSGGDRGRGRGMRGGVHGGRTTGTPMSRYGQGRGFNKR